MRALLLILPLLALASCDGGHDSEQYEYWTGIVPPDLPGTWDETLAKVVQHYKRGEMFARKQELYDHTVNVCKDLAREQGWEEFQPQRWRRPKYE